MGAADDPSAPLLVVVVAAGGAVAAEGLELLAGGPATVGGVGGAAVGSVDVCAKAGQAALNVTIAADKMNLFIALFLCGARPRNLNFGTHSRFRNCGRPQISHVVGFGQPGGCLENDQDRLATPAKMD